MDHRDPAADAEQARRSARENASIQGLVAEALREATDLARKEVALFRAEMSHNVKLLIAGIVALLASSVFAIATLVLLTDALVDWIAVLVDSAALASLIVAGVTLVITIALILYGRSKLSSATLEPTHTIRSVERDGDVLSHRRH
ncbi:phage holin family protein [Salinarimonas rosea]|uniref:phage holin family protein n=1 Tax=Salinarimonas rosea TaxID=552063 RepID=UPI000411715E|nr:phage holin family protein [Salinarimonas rosea]